jgi:hypothetical protein
MSLDLGHTWINVGTFPGYIRAIRQTESVFYVIVDTTEWSGRLLYRSTNFGQDWDQLGNLSLNSLSLVLIGDTVVALNSGNCVLWNGSQWETRGPIPPTNQPVWFSMVGIPGTTPLIVGATWDSTVLWKSTDLGMSWQGQDFDMPYDGQISTFHRIYYDPYRNWVWAVTGIGTCYLDANELSANEPLHFKPADYTLLSVYPNPFNSTAKIRYDLLKPEQVKIVMHDLLGRELKTIVNELQSAGRHEKLLEMPGDASGLYFVRLQTASQTKTQKIALIR